VRQSNRVATSRSRTLRGRLLSHKTTWPGGPAVPALSLRRSTRTHQRNPIARTTATVTAFCRFPSGSVSAAMTAMHQARPRRVASISARPTWRSSGRRWDWRSCVPGTWSPNPGLPACQSGTQSRGEPRSRSRGYWVSPSSPRRAKGSGGITGSSPSTGRNQQMLSMRRLLSKPSSRLSLAGNQGSQPGRSALRQLRYRLPLLPGREAPRVVGLGDTQRRRAEEAAHHRRYDRGRPHARFKAEGDPTVDGVA